VAEAALRPGEVLVLFTDGVLDAISHRGRLDPERLVERLREAPAGAAAVIEHLEGALAGERDGRRDDTAAVALEFVGAPVALA
jgi:serine phosphatase RsbU (regulator of sigma subunit)